MTGRRPPEFAYEVEVDDVQSIALQALTDLPEAYFLFVRDLRGPHSAKWLAALADQVARGATAPPGTARAINIALTHAGLQAIGLDRATCNQFGIAFQQGMSGGGGHRSWELGDVGDSAPFGWRWGNTPTEKGEPPPRPVHAVVLLYANSDATLKTLVDEQRGLAADCGVDLYAEASMPMRASWPHANGARGAGATVEGLREHFGFVDGISQPEFRMRADALDEHLIAPGELLLGYPNEAGTFPPSPTIPATTTALELGLRPAADGLLDLGRNGSYLVFRHIAQDVRGFWEFARAHATAHAKELGTIERCAAKMIGRWRNGAPLTTTPAQPQNLNELDRQKNDFQFAADADGRDCPVGAHVRRANPRDTLPGLSARRSLDEVRRHRILRRGRPFGAPLSGWPDPEQMLAAPAAIRISDQRQDDPWSRGMHFLCLNADIEEQFEFVQQRWINDPTFVNQRTDEVDPILGRQRDTPTFRVPAEPTPVVLGNAAPLRRFTQIIGGEYFFLPSHRALKYLAAIATTRG
jgi:Dyp-type peroxidase family